MPSDNPYLNETDAALPRVLALFDSNPISSTFGQGDRFRWGWKLIDFVNGTYQGAAHGLAALLSANLLPDAISESAALRRIEAMFHGAAGLRRRDGSIDQAFPFEGSFGATAFTAYDLLAAIELLGERLSESQRQHFIDVVRPMIRFLLGNEETHGFISNHLAGAAAALYRWSALTGEEGRRRGEALLDRVIRAQSKEGWFPEYGGADPGYQTRCMQYLADVHRLRQDAQLLEPLRASARFLWHFAHPDGSFGGVYGSRNTRIFYPAGFEMLKDELPECDGLAEFMRRSIAEQRTVTLRAMDDPNLVPLFNAYCVAATWYERASKHESKPVSQPVPAMARQTIRHAFPQAGLLIDAGPDHYTVISTNKGGVCCHFCGRDDAAMIDAGVVMEDSAGRVFSTQAFNPRNEVALNDASIIITAPLTRMRSHLPTPVQFIVLRLLNISFMRIGLFREWVKKALVRLLITRRSESAAKNVRTIRLGRDLSITDERRDGEGLRRRRITGSFSAIHMASQGYWQRHDDAV